jgi:hypothetical protein
MTALEIVLCVVMLPFMFPIWFLANPAQGLFAAERWQKRDLLRPQRSGQQPEHSVEDKNS